MQAFVTLNGCLYSQAVNAMQSVQQLQHQIVAITFKLSWPAVRVIKAAKSYAVLAAEGYDTYTADSDDLESQPAHVGDSDSDDDELYLRSGLRPKFTISAREQPKLEATEEQVNFCAHVAPPALSKKQMAASRYLQLHRTSKSAQQAAAASL